MWERDGEQSQRVPNNSGGDRNATGTLLMVPRQVSWLKAREPGGLKSLNAVKIGLIKMGLKQTISGTRLMSRSGFVSLGTADIWSWITFVVGGRPAHCRTFSSIPGLHSPDATSTRSPVVKIKNVSRHCQVSSGGAKSPSFENQCSQISVDVRITWGAFSRCFPGLTCGGVGLIWKCWGGSAW